MPVALLWLSVVGVELVALGVQFDSCVTLRAPVLRLIVYMDIDIELVQ